MSIGVAWPTNVNGHAYLWLMATVSVYIATSFFIRNSIGNMLRRLLTLTSSLSGGGAGDELPSSLAPDFCSFN